MGMIEVHIDELVLRGDARPDCRDLVEAIQQALTRRLETDGLPGSWKESKVITELNAGPAEARPGRTTDAVGSAVARCLTNPRESRKGTA